MADVSADVAAGTVVAVVVVLVVVVVGAAVVVAGPGAVEVEGEPRLVLSAGLQAVVAVPELTAG